MSRIFQITMIKNIFKTLGVLGVIGLFGVFPAVASAATLTFTPSSGTLNKGCEVTVKIDLDTQGVQTDGTDVIVLYTPAQLSITTAQITNGTIYPEYPGNSVDATGGKISISGISSVSAPFTGTGTFATLKFKVADTLAANTPINISFDFDPNNKTKTTDTNVVERGTIADVLNSVTNGTYTVGTGSCASGITASPTPNSLTGLSQGQSLSGNNSSSQSAQFPVYQPNVNELPSAGLLDNTFAITAVGIVLVILGVAGLAML
jgi:hypothetical protein